MLRYSFLGKVPFSATLTAQESARQQLVAFKNSARCADLQASPHTLFGFEVAHPTYTYGRRYRDRMPAEEQTRLEAIKDCRVVQLPRGGHATFHGPGQLVMYPVVDLHALKLRVRDYVCILEKSIVEVLGKYGVDAEQRPGVGLNGVWLANTNAKIAFVGVSASRSITQFGLSLNINVDPFYFSQITPCNLTNIKVVSLAEVIKGDTPQLSDVSLQLAQTLAGKFKLELRE